MDIPIPEVYVQVTQADDGTEEYGAVDGQQRLRTILQFIGIESAADQVGEDNNQFALERLPTASIYKDKTFGDVAGDARKRFYQYEICVRFLGFCMGRKVARPKSLTNTTNIMNSMKTSFPVKLKPNISST